MTIQLNPMAQAEIEAHQLAKRYEALKVSGQIGGAWLGIEIAAIISKAVFHEKLMMGEHEQCGADNPEGTTALCKCHCHTGHYRHRWEPMIKTPVLNPDGTYHLLDRCKYCPDLRLKIIKTAWVGETHKLVSLEYLVRGEHKVLSKEEWLEKSPEPAQESRLKEKGL